MSNQITCPHCNKAFTVDEAGYAAILKQVHDAEFEKEIAGRLKLVQESQEKDTALALSEAEKVKEKALAAKEAEIQKLNAEVEAKKIEIQTATQNAVVAKQDEIQKKDLQIQKLENDIANAGKDKVSSLNEATADLKIKLVEAKAELDKLTTEKELAVRFEQDLRKSDAVIYQDQIETLKDFRSKQNSALLGQDLEQHCLNSFNKVRAWAFPNATFGKDNDASSGSKGDFVFKDYTPEGVCYLSIMFEMKNQKDTEETGVKTETFFKKLDKDRKQKGCEFAVLVSQLEPNSELYNDGIVNVSYEYPNMFVIRPQFFIPFITFLRTAALNNVEAVKELDRIKKENFDFARFEENLTKFGNSWNKKYELASTHFGLSIKEIDKAITALEKVKAELKETAGYLEDTAEVANKITIKALTVGSPSMKEKFKELGSKSENLEE
jgi:hypothetical protein